MGVSSFLVLAGTMENTPFIFLPQEILHRRFYATNAKKESMKIDYD